MKILLTTLHAKYSHASLALPCLAAACRHYSSVETTIKEYTINEPREAVLRHIVAESASLVAFSCYIWNIRATLDLADDIKKISPSTIILLGGPEVSFGVFELMDKNPAIDFVIKGEGEIPFSRLVELLKRSEQSSPSIEELQVIPNLFLRDGDAIHSTFISATAANLGDIPSPFSSGLVDMKKPLTYYETSRGCPFSCAFCLSSTEGGVRSYPMERIEADLLYMMERNTPQIKLVDRTFNYDRRRADAIWRFILDNNQNSRFHFEIAADLLDETSLALLSEVPPDTFRFEIGVQSASADVLERVGRSSDLSRLQLAVQRLRQETTVQLHLDLVAGLPGEDYEGFLDSLQFVADLKPEMIQVEPLKLLKGSPMRTIADREKYSYSSTPPYTILKNPWLSYHEICRIETIGDLLDLFHAGEGFATAIAFMQKRHNLSRMLHQMAEQAGRVELSGMSTVRRYQLFAELAAPLIPNEEQPLLYDALLFDFCRAEMPQKGRLPAFANLSTRPFVWLKGKELRENRYLPDNARVRAVSCIFMRDYRNKPWQERETEITFVYVSAQGEGLTISVEPYLELVRK